MFQTVIFAFVFISVIALQVDGLRIAFARSLRQTTKLFGEVEVKNLDNGQAVMIESGSPLSLACVRSGMRLSFQCKAGTCSSCEVMLDGKRVRTCITKVGNKKSTVKKAKPL